MYWAEFGGSVIKRANLDGTSVETVITGLGGPVAIVLIGPPGVTPPDADLKVVKTGAPNPVIAGTNLTHTLTVTNLSTTTAATNVKVKDKISPGTTLVSSVATGGGSCSGTTDITCTFSSRGFGSSTTVPIVVSVNSTTTWPLINVATTTADTMDSVISNNTFKTVTTGPSVPSMSVWALAILAGLLLLTLNVNSKREISMRVSPSRG